jgi:DNA excision repair protein ERCC-2
VRMAIPGRIRKAEHYLRFMKDVIQCLKREMSGITEPRTMTPLVLLNKMQETYQLDQRALKHARERLTSLLNTLEISEIDKYTSLNVIADFATLLATEYKGFSLILEPHPEADKWGAGGDPLLQFYCLDASIATKPIFEKFKNVILTSGTISPIEIYPKILDFKPEVSKAFDIELPRNAISPIIVTKGNDQIAMSSKFEERENQANIRNYGNLILRLSETVPDGIVCFFTSYKYMEHMIV